MPPQGPLLVDQLQSTGGARQVIVVDGDTARVTSDWLVFEKIGEQPWTVFGASRADDRLIREDGAWRFAWKEA